MYDYEEMALYCSDLWLKFYDHRTTTKQRHQLLYKMLKDVDIVFDLPFYFYWKELLDIFPDCKIVFHERNEDEWFYRAGWIFLVF